MKRQVVLLGAVIVIVVAALGLWLALRGSDDPDGPDTPIGDTVRFDFDADLTTPASGDFSVAQATANGGEVTGGPSYPGAGQAAVFPAFAGGAAGPRAVLAVSDPAAPQTLSPGEARFRFGVDVQLDEPSEGGDFDNGNNILQRGLFGMSAQFKLQIDKGRASCRLEGDAGGVTVKSRVEIEPGTWYRLTCEREGDGALISVAAISGSGELGESVEDEESGDIGSIDPPPDTPMSIGGKLDRRQEVEDESDQFNGSLDNVFVAIG